MNGLLCFEQYDKCTPQRFDRKNIIVRPGLLEFIKILLRSFKVGIWSSMVPSRLKKVLEVLLPDQIQSKLLFFYGRNKCGRIIDNPFCYKVLDRLSKDCKTKEFCLPDKVLIVDVQPMWHLFNGDCACYFPRSWSSETSLPNGSNVIPNITTTLIPFIFPLRNYASVSEYLQRHKMDGKLKRRVLETRHYNQIFQTA